MTEPEANPPARAARPRPSVGRPALFYVLAAFGMVFGAFTSAAAVAGVLSDLAPRDVYVEAFKTSNHFRALTMPADDFERFGTREAEARWDRRKAELPLALAGIIISCMLFSGAVRGMLGDGAAVGTWLLAATVAIPHRILLVLLQMVTARDIMRAFGGAKEALPLVESVQYEQVAALIVGGLLLIYFGVCALYLRRPSVLASFTSGGGSRPSA